MPIEPPLDEPELLLELEPELELELLLLELLELDVPVPPELELELLLLDDAVDPDVLELLELLLELELAALLEPTAVPPDDVELDVLLVVALEPHASPVSAKHSRPMRFVPFMNQSVALISCNNASIDGCPLRARRLRRCERHPCRVEQHRWRHGDRLERFHGDVERIFIRVEQLGIFVFVEFELEWVDVREQQLLLIKQLGQQQQFIQLEQRLIEWQLERNERALNPARLRRLLGHLRNQGLGANRRRRLPRRAAPASGRSLVHRAVRTELPLERGRMVAEDVPGHG